MIYDVADIIDRLNGELEKNQKKQKITSEDELSKILEALSKDLESQSEASKSQPEAPKLQQKDLLVAFSELRLKLAEHMKLDHVLFLFGNGASIYAGSKDTHEFKIQSYKKKYPALREIIDEVGKLSGIEEQLNALITSRSYYHLMHEDETENYLKQLIDELNKNLIERFVNSVDYRRLSQHEAFLFKLHNFGCLSRTSIYTPNYDLAFEYSLDKLAIEYNNGFSGFVNRTFDPRTLREKGKTALVKIYGPVNWVMEGDNVKELQPRFKDGRVEIDYTAPVFIYPTSHKLYQTYSIPYSELMRHMLNEMETNKNVIVVLGYSYGDEHINEVLLKALRNPNNIFYFFSYDPNNTFVGQLKHLVDSIPNINVLTGRVLADFNTFVNYMLPVTIEKSDEEKVIEQLREVLKGHAG